MKKPACLLTRRELLRGSAAAGGLAMLGAPISVLGQVSDSGSTFGSLADSFGNRLVTPDHDAYDSARSVWNAMIDKHPAAVARCRGAADVIEVINYARDNDMEISVRGGGHNVAGKAVKDDAIVVDLAPMHGVIVDPVRKRAVAQGGVRWGGFDRETVAHGLLTTGGTVGTTGVGGLTLGGGVGWVMRKHGLTCDNVISANVVTADGHHRVANAEQNPDLYWALRGGGGNFGVVTSFEYQLHDVESITGGMALWPRDQLEDMMHFYRDYMANAPDSVTAMAAVMIGPPGTSVEGQSAGLIAVCHKGDAAEGERLLRPIKEFGTPALDIIGPSDYIGVQSLFSAAGAPGTRNYWRSSFVRDLSDDIIDLLIEHADEIPPPGTLLLLEPLGGAVSRIGEHETAFANRGAAYNVSVLGSWIDAADDEGYIGWTRMVGDKLRSFSTGGAYVNYMADDSSPEQVKAAYEANFQRLVEVKRKYDPDNFFNANQNIAP
jgi:FAD/FMN-containing dehydrogenase